MKNIELVTLKRLKDTTLYEAVEEGIYRELSDKGLTPYRMIISYVIETGDADDEHPLKDMMDEYGIYGVQYICKSGANALVELGGSLEALHRTKYVLGKRIRSEAYQEDGNKRMRLVIE